MTKVRDISSVARARTSPEERKRTLPLLVTLLGDVDQPLHVLRHLVHGILPPRGLAIPSSSAIPTRSHPLPALRSTTTNGRHLPIGHEHADGCTGGHGGLVARLLDGGHDVEVKVVGIRVVGDELRDLDAGDKVLVRVGHEVIVLGLPKAEKVGSATTLETDRGCALALTIEAILAALRLRFCSNISCSMILCSTFRINCSPAADLACSSLCPSSPSALAPPSFSASLAA